MAGFSFWGILLRVVSLSDNWSPICQALCQNPEVLKSANFFKTPKGLGEIRKKFADMGHHYPLTTLSGAMQTQAKKRNR
jgi:hypothetical protein